MSWMGAVHVDTARTSIALQQEQRRNKAILDVRSPSQHITLALSMTPWCIRFVPAPRDQVKLVIQYAVAIVIPTNRTTNNHHERRPVPVPVCFPYLFLSLFFLLRVNQT
jgi:hypothetical protein